MNREYRLPAKPVTYDRLMRLAEDICLSYGAMKKRASVGGIESKLIGLDSPYLQTHWETMIDRKLVPKGWENWVRSGFFSSMANLPPEMAVGTILGSVRDVIEFMDLWDHLRVMMRSLSVDVGAVPPILAVRNRDLTPSEFPWIRRAEEIVDGIRKHDPISEQMGWPCRGVERIFSIVCRWELARRDGEVSTACPLYPMALMFKTGLIPSFAETLLPCGRLRT